MNENGISKAILQQQKERLLVKIGNRFYHQQHLQLMDISEEYKDLTDKLGNNLPLTAYPIRELVQIFRNKGNPITLRTELTITDVYNSGDISGIMCTVQNKKENVIVCALTHLIFSPECPLYREICEYQRKREKRIKKLNQMGLS